MFEAKVLARSGKPSSLVVFLHGYGASGQDLIDLAYPWSKILTETDFVSPNAFERCDGCFLGYQWFGLNNFDAYLSSEQIKRELERIRPKVFSYLKNLLDERQLSPQHLVLVGFSQGTMVALDMLSSFPTLGGVLGYSGAFYPPAAPINAVHPTPVFLIHGEGDMLVPYPIMNEAALKLKDLGFNVKTHTCVELGHGIDAEGIELGSQFLNSVLAS